MNAAIGADRSLIFPSILLIVLTVVIAALPFFVQVPDPTGGITFDHASVSINDGPSNNVTLPYSWPALPSDEATAKYVLEFVLGSRPNVAQDLFIPTVRQSLTASLNGTPLYSFKETPWANLSRGYVMIVRIPPGLLLVGKNELILTLTRSEGFVPGYLSRLHLDDAGKVVGKPYLAMLLSAQSRTITFALHVFIVIGLLTVWAARPSDATFRWLAIIGVASLAMVTAELRMLPDIVQAVRPYLIMLLSSLGLMVVAVALAICEITRPAWLISAIIGIPIVFIAVVATGLAPYFATAVFGAIIAIAGHVTASIILARAFFIRRRWEYGLLAVPFLLTAWFGLRDIAVVTGLVPGGFLLSTFVRPLTFLTLLVLLMYRLAASLNRLDRTNDVLRHRLAQQQTELSVLHEKEKILTGHAVREQERQRLMYDLHDGLSGHLVSIIALAECEPGSAKIERAAREALDDLRLVIHSLDLRDTDLSLALAGFRERLAPQLRRLGVELIWSMDQLPEVYGVTPGNALSVLRILQEAVTNALKHGRAREIAIKGSPGLDKTAIVTVTNDGRPSASSGQGHGLANMQRRAKQLGGDVSLTKAECGAELVLSLPLRLPDV
jgi:signal transduction histidine kinase